MGGLLDCGGTPRAVVLDNLRRDLAGLLRSFINPLYRDLLTHYGAVALPCRFVKKHGAARVEDACGAAREFAVNWRFGRILWLPGPFSKLYPRPSNRKLAASVRSHALEILTQPDWHDFAPSFAAAVAMQFLKDKGLYKKQDPLKQSLDASNHPLKQPPLSVEL